MYLIVDNSFYDFRTVGLLGSSPVELHNYDGVQSDQPLDLDTPAVCQTLPGLTDQQKNVCSRAPETSESVPFGTRQGLVECEYQFR